jgi:transcriptional regulator GlxA family with amidase domain
VIGSLNDSKVVDNSRIQTSSPSYFAFDLAYLLTAPANDDSPIARVQAHVMDHIADAFPVEKLAEIAGMSPRNFARQFVEETGVTPHEFIERARVDVARNLLEGSNLALKAVAYHSGFSNPDRMRIVFAKRLGISPAQYRANFQRE